MALRQHQQPCPASHWPRCSCAAPAPCYLCRPAACLRNTLCPTTPCAARELDALGGYNRGAVRRGDTMKHRLEWLKVRCPALCSHLCFHLHAACARVRVLHRVLWPVGPWATRPLTHSLRRRSWWTKGRPSTPPSQRTPTQGGTRSRARCVRASAAGPPTGARPCAVRAPTGACIPGGSSLLGWHRGACTSGCCCPLPLIPSSLICNHAHAHPPDPTQPTQPPLPCMMCPCRR